MPCNWQTSSNISIEYTFFVVMPAALKVDKIDNFSLISSVIHYHL